MSATYFSVEREALEDIGAWIDEWENAEDDTRHKPELMITVIRDKVRRTLSEEIVLFPSMKQGSC